MDKVVYRKYKNGEIIALFPRIAARIDGYACLSYVHVGQHSAADISTVVKQTALATPDEYAELHAELERIGYNPKPNKRCTWQDYKIRRAQYN